MAGDEYRLLPALRGSFVNNAASPAAGGDSQAAAAGGPVTSSSGTSVTEANSNCSVIVCGNNCTVTQTSIGKDTDRISQCLLLIGRYKSLSLSHWPAQSLDYFRLSQWLAG